MYAVGTPSFSLRRTLGTVSLATTLCLAAGTSLAQQSTLRSSTPSGNTPTPVPTQPAAPAAAPAAAGTPAATTGGQQIDSQSIGDWVVNCGVNDQGKKLCLLLQQQVKSDTRERVLAVELRAAPQGGAVGVLALPFGLDLQRGVQLTLDGKPLGKPLTFRTCVPGGCLVPLNFDAAGLAQLRKGKALATPAYTADGGQSVPFSVSLDGLSAAFDHAIAQAK